MRVVKWVMDRAHGRVSAVQSPFGWTPTHADLEWGGLDYGTHGFREVMEIERAAGHAEADDQAKFFARFGDRLPPAMERQRRALIARLDAAPEVWWPAA